MTLYGRNIQLFHAGGFYHAPQPMALDATHAYNSILLFYPVSSIQDALIMHTLCSHYVVMTLQLCGHNVELALFLIQGEQKRNVSSGGNLLSPSLEKGCATRPALAASIYDHNSLRSPVNQILISPLPCEPCLRSES